jgi:hypothetical protein
LSDLAIDAIGQHKASLSNEHTACAARIAHLAPTLQMKHLTSNGHCRLPTI